MKTLTKMNIKLLLRNKMVLLFLLAASLFSTLLLNQKSENSLYYGKEDAQIITELPSADDKAVYLGNPSLFLVKVYDASNTVLSEYLLEQLLLVLPLVKQKPWPKKLVLMTVQVLSFI